MAEVCADLLELFGGVSDGRSGQGRDHPVRAVLALAAAAVVADLYPRSGAAPAGSPSKSTIWRVLTDADPEAFDAAVGTWLMRRAGMAGPPAEDAGRAEQPGISAPPADAEQAGEPAAPGFVRVRLDGKAVRGAKNAAGNQMRLLAALVGADAASSVIAAQTEVGAKTNEVPMATAVLNHIDLNGTIVTADALHTVKATAQHIHDHGGQFIFPVKENRRALFDAIDALPWTETPTAHTTTDTGHGRITTRTIQVLPAPDDLPFRTSTRYSSSKGT